MRHAYPGSAPLKQLKHFLALSANLLKQTPRTPRLTVSIQGVLQWSIRLGLQCLPA
jgi:hypothetical protein